MAEPGQNLARITGIITLLLLAILLLPQVFKGQGSETSQTLVEHSLPAIVIDGSHEPDSVVNPGRYDSFLALPEDDSSQQSDSTASAMASDEPGLAGSESETSRASMPSDRVAEQLTSDTDLPSPTDSIEPDTDDRVVAVLAEQNSPGWVLQLGSFSQQANAQRLLERVQAEQFPAFIRQVPGDRTLYQVMVGPYQEESQARTQQPLLQLAFELSPLVLRWQPQP